MVGRKHGIPADDKWFHNIFVHRGLEGVAQAPGYASDYNLFLEGAKKSSFADEHSIVDPAGAAFHRTDSPLGVAIGFRVNQVAFGVKGPWVGRELVGVVPTAGQTIEDCGGRPLRVDSDILGDKRASPIAGPLADLKPGENTLKWSMRAQ